ncbi:MAG: molecular chaperone [Alphaproteobacteria bacterium]|nr:molecular chaperone [Alphaproteobacteria bacterium]
MLKRMTVRRIAAAVGLIGALLAGVGHEAAAYRLVPITMEFDPSGRGASQTFGVVNDTTEPVAVEISMVKRIVDLDGKENNVLEEEDFVVFPPQVVVLPGKVQVVRVRWVGDSEPKTELAYRIIAEQLPIDINAPPKQGGSVQLLLAFEGSVYIVPTTCSPTLCSIPSRWCRARAA